MDLTSLATDKIFKVLGQYEGSCGKCPCNLKNYLSPMLHDAPLIVVGSSPTAKEVEGGGFLTSGTGDYLRTQFAVAGIDNFAYTTVTKCLPSGNKIKERAISCCMAQHTLKEVEPYSIVVLLGAEATRAFFPGTRANFLRGNLARHPDYPGKMFYALYDPSWVFQDKHKNEPEFVKHVSRLGRIVNEGIDVPWKLLQGWEPSYLARLTEILSGQYAAFDLETDSVKSWEASAKIKSFAIYGGGSEVVVGAVGDPHYAEAMKLVRDFTEDKSKIVIGHNVSFDLVFLDQKLGGWSQCRIADTQNLFYTLYGEKMPSLKYLTSKYLDGYRYLLVNPHLHWLEDQHRLALMMYNAEDVVVAWDLFVRYAQYLTEDQKNLYWNISCPASLALQRLHTAGFCFDLDYAVKASAKIDTQKIQLLEDWRAFDPKFNPDSHLTGDGLKTYIHHHRRIPITETTASGQPSTDATHLKYLQQKHGDEKWISLLLEYRKAEKLQNTYLSKYISGEKLGSDGKVHSSFFNTYTDTGRANSASPNGQNIPRGPIIRTAFVPSPGNILIHADYSQVELRLAMCLAEDPVGIQAYLDGSDLHQETANSIAAMDGRDVATKEDRSNAKPVNFALIYGGSTGTLQRYAFATYGVVFSDEEAKRYVRTFFTTYARLSLWHTSIIGDLRAGQGYLTSVMGHRKLYDAWDSLDSKLRERAERSAINMTCQSPAGYITLGTLAVAMQLAYERGLFAGGKLKFVSTVHDSILVDCPEEILQPVMQCLRDAVDILYDMVKHWLIVPLVMDFETGDSWGNLKEVS